MLKLLLVSAGLAVLLPAGVFAAVCVCAAFPRRRRDADCLIVLGARVRPDRSMSYALRYRCETALKAYREGVAKAIFLCGGQCTVDPCPEAHVMREFFLENDVPEKDLILEDASTNTIENLRNAREIMRMRGYRRAAMITSDYHLTRALLIARDVGLDVWGIAAPSPGLANGFVKARLQETASWFLYFKRKIKGEI